MDDMETVRRLAAAVLLGALVGLQRELTRSRLGGVRTFPLVGLVGFLCGMLAEGSPLTIAAGVVAVLGLTVVGNLRAPHDDHKGITTEAALLATFLIGAWCALGSLAVAVIAGATVAVLLQFKPELHGMVHRLSEEDAREIMRFAVLAMIVLPILPDKAYGPMNTLNPYEAWLMVVLVVGLNLAGYIAHKFVGARGGVAAAGVLGGLVSSTATTFGYARLAAREPKVAPVSAAVILLACATVYPRQLVEIGVAAPALLQEAAPPLLLAALVGAAGALWVFASARGGEADRVEPKNPGSLAAALGFGVLFALVGLALALARREVEGSEWAVAAVSGITDVDAVTLSSARLAASGSLPPDTAWRLALVAASANTLSKAALAVLFAGRLLVTRAVLPLLVSAAAAATLAALWP